MKCSRSPSSYACSLRYASLPTHQKGVSQITERHPFLRDSWLWISLFQTQICCFAMILAGIKKKCWSCVTETIYTLIKNKFWTFIYILKENVYTAIKTHLPMIGWLKLVPDVHTSFRWSQDSAALWSGGISGSWSWLCLPNTGASPTLSSVWQLLDAQLDGWVAGGVVGAGRGSGLECKRRKSCAAAAALSLTGLTSTSRAAASSARTRAQSFSISLMLALSCCRDAEEKLIFPVWVK